MQTHPHAHTHTHTHTSTDTHAHLNVPDKPYVIEGQTHNLIAGHYNWPTKLKKFH